MQTLFSLGDPTTCFPINIETSVPTDPWPASNVTLLGDAIHTMTPGMGVGANTALRDAALLCRRLTEVRDGERSLISAVQAYESRMVEYGFQAVIDSRKRTGGEQLVHEPVVGRIALAGLRTALRIADRLPTVKRRMLDDLHRRRSEVDD